ncbi:hypothetical protein [Dulcicalothrix desertica]|uniref:hypothetical protein n=1 Tax=Dulcicalothrix desertica TaxID=32056 RepID=UPI000F8EDC20|nr:hypothetical protein [Dulcicalothrix desertica]TWH43991.1 hypothetical protein CAL7102_07754 [Dulcicalothrix desertica PCC 7102]
MKKLLFSALIVVSTFTCLAPSARALPRPKNLYNISNDRQAIVVQLADRGKPGNPIPAGRR